MERAAEELAEARRLNRDRWYTSIARLGYESIMPLVRELFEATSMAGLRKAGMPEERGSPAPRRPVTAAPGDVAGAEPIEAAAPSRRLSRPFRRGFGRGFRAGAPH